MNENQIAPAQRLLLVDDHVVAREGLRRILERTGEPWAITDAGSGLEALEHLRNRAFDLAIVDLSMPGMGGLELIGRIRSEFPHVAVLVLSVHAEHVYALRSYRAGASAYLTKDSTAAELVDAVRKVARGGVHVSPSLAEQVVKQFSGQAHVPLHAHLSEREFDVLKRIVRGQKLTDIARELCLSIKTVSTHKSRILEKLGLGSTAALVRYGLEQRLDGEIDLPPPDTPGQGEYAPRQLRR
jgi:DNA-binding NarL/FixJ family response regulator